MDLTWLRWARQLQAIAQNGLTYGTDPYDSERYESVRAIANEIVPAGTQLQVVGHEQFLLRVMPVTGMPGAEMPVPGTPVIPPGAGA